MATRKQAGSGAPGTGRSGATGAGAKTAAGRTGPAAKTSAGRTGQAAKTAAGNARQAQGKAGLVKASQGEPGQQRAQATSAPAGRSRQDSKPSQAGDKAADSLVAARPTGWHRMTAYAGTNKLEFSTLVISLLGLCVSIYLTIEEFTSNAALACPDTGAVNCAKVLTSAQSHVFGIPVAVLGLAFFVFMVAVNTPWGWRARQPVVHWARLGSVIVGICFVLYLVWAELFAIGAICLYCTSVHVLTFLLFALIVARATLTGLRPSPARA